MLDQKLLLTLTSQRNMQLLLCSSHAATEQLRLNPYCNLLMLLHTAGQATQPRNQNQGRAGWQKDSYRADWSQRQPQPGNADKAPGAESGDYDNQLQKPVLQGRAKAFKEQPR